MTRGDRIAAIIEQVRPFGNGWLHCDERHWWLLVTEAGTGTDTPVRWVRTFADMDAVNAWVRDDLTGDEHATLLVDLVDGEQHVPALVWVPHRCSWPCCTQPPAADGREFLGGRMCDEHTADSHERDSAARDEIAAAAAAQRC